MWLVDNTAFSTWKMNARTSSNKLHMEFRKHSDYGSYLSKKIQVVYGGIFSI